MGGADKGLLSEDSDHHHNAANDPVPQNPALRFAAGYQKARTYPAQNASLNPRHRGRRDAPPSFVVFQSLDSPVGARTGRVFTTSNRIFFHPPSAFSALQTDVKTGLTARMVEQRLAEWGPNELPEKKVGAR